MVKRAEAAGCPVLVFTVDQISGTNRETLRRFARQDTRDCRVCDRSNLQTLSVRRPMFSGFDLAGVAMQPPVTWDYVKRLKDTTTMRLAIKGIVTREDAALAVSNGADAIVCSNHGGRAEETGRSSIESLRKSWKAPRGACRSSSTAVSAVARTSSRPSRLAPPPSAWGDRMWGLAAFGQEGVEVVLDILTRELQLAMRYAGTAAIPNITRAHVVERR